MRLPGKVISSQFLSMKDRGTRSLQHPGLLNVLTKSYHLNWVV
jgi:hypothetical protein